MERAGRVELWMIIVCLILIVHSHSVYARNIIEAFVLQEFMNKLGGNKTTLSNWNVSSLRAPCDWEHIRCDNRDDYVSSIFLGGVGIGGPINGDLLSSLSKLNHLDLSYNYMNGSIPDAFGNITFTRLVLNNNRISGRIPCSLSKQYDIPYDIDLRNNKLGGCIPHHLAHKKSFYHGGNSGLEGTCSDC